MGRSYVGDINTKIETTLNEDLTGYSSVIYYVMKGGGTSTTWNCVVESTTQGIVYYNVQSGDFNESGKYKIHTVVEFIDGSLYSSELKTFTVYDRFYG